MANLKGLKCKGCGREYPIEPANVCDFCFGPLEVEYDYDAIAKIISRTRISNGPLNMWRYKDLLPVQAEHAVDLDTGFTPLFKAKMLGGVLGLNELYVKNDAVNPSYSFKDRVVGIAATKALEFEFDTLACASTGNLAGSVAAHAAKAGMKSTIFIPADLEAGKVIGAAIYGPTVVAVKGSYDDVNRLCSELVDTYNWAFVNINMRAYYQEGSKTLGFEVAEQLGWKTPAHCVVPAASGTLYTKIKRGFDELSALNLIPPVTTRMHVTQPMGCSPIVSAWNAGATHVRPVKPNTIAKSLAIGNPADGFYALETARGTNGTATAVPEDEIVEGIKLLAETEGIFTETAGGVTIAGLRQLVKQGTIRPDETTVVYITGNGLKTQEAVEKVVNTLLIEPTVDAFQRALEANS